MDAQKRICGIKGKILSPFTRAPLPVVAVEPNENMSTSTTCLFLEKSPRDKDGRILMYDESHCKFAYQWDQYPKQGLFDHDCPWINGEFPMIRSISWTSNPTKEEQEITQNGTLGPDINLDTEHTEMEAVSRDKVRCDVHHRKRHGPQIINSAKLPLEPFGLNSTAIMRTCQQIEYECALILYGENSYAFHTYRTSRDKDLKNLLLDIPGLAFDGGVAHFHKLTIHDIAGEEPEDGILRVVDLDNAQTETDEDRVDEIVGRVVGRLPTLQNLQLGDYVKVPRPETDDAWGKSLRWMSFVEKRHRDQMKQG
ncbi:hypothetical protein SBOR_9200 [Sclerotinia borealis F-4128]|uniref:Uncharacterized protein n=1 Tax=Sclerotinia borealis (strain F-4128) TaxID=1432307 RepID=W9C0T9_SCLBF|nr:hypothetical protein SBOR_9200 [Sclerotinia borealis F-4128]